MFGSAVLATVAMAISLVGASSALAAASTVYTNEPNVLPGNLPSLGYEATSTSEFGGKISLAGSERKAVNLRFALSSWGCESRPGGVCTTSSGAKFPVPITARIYRVGPGGEPGELLAQATKTFQINYRPSANSKKCTGGRWYKKSEDACYNGKYLRRSIAFKKETLANNVIVSLAYNTTHHGYNPIGESAPCYGTPAGCGYDSLNVALGDYSPSVGGQPNPDDGWLNSTWGGAYCDGGGGGVGTFRLDAGCWTDYQPVLRLKAK